MSDLVKAVILGLVQGVTEFLPVSSSGHLKALEMVLGFDVALSFDVALHVATLAAVLVYFGRDLLRLLRSPDLWPVTLRVGIGTVPAVVIAMGFKEWRETIGPWFVVAGWCASSAYLLLSARREGPGEHRALPLAKAFIIGGSQGLAALIPGFSRSGISITSGLWLGLRREEAFRFSFLLAIPVMFGAGLVHCPHLFDPAQRAIPGGWIALAAAMTAAFAVGLLAIHLLYQAVTGSRFHQFGWYNLAAAAAFAIYLGTKTS